MTLLFSKTEPKGTYDGDPAKLEIYDGSKNEVDGDNMLLFCYEGLYEEDSGVVGMDRVDLVKIYDIIGDVLGYSRLSN